MTAILDAAFPSDLGKAKFYSHRFVASMGFYGRTGYSVQWLQMQLGGTAAAASDLTHGVVAARMHIALGPNEAFPLEIYPSLRTLYQFVGDYTAYLKLLTTEYVYNELCCTMYSMRESEEKGVILPNGGFTMECNHVLKVLFIITRLLTTHEPAESTSVMNVVFRIAQLLLPASVIPQLITKILDLAKVLAAKYPGRPHYVALIAYFKK